MIYLPRIIKFVATKGSFVQNHVYLNYCSLRRSCMKKNVWLPLFALVIASFSSFSHASDLLEERIHSLENESKQLQESKQVLKTKLDEQQKSEKLLIPIHLENEWVAVPVSHQELEALLSIWELTGNENPVRALNDAQTVIEFTHRYQDEIQQKILANTAKIDKNTAEIRQLQQQLEENKTAQALSPVPYLVPNGSIGPQSKSNGVVTIAIENVKPITQNGFKKWDFDWVFTEHSGVGVTFTTYELQIFSPNPGANKVKKDTISLRIDGGHVFRGPGSMWVERNPPDEKDSDMHAQLYAIYRGKDDNGHDVVAEAYFFK